MISSSISHDDTGTIVNSEKQEQQQQDGSTTCRSQKQQLQPQSQALNHNNASPPSSTPPPQPSSSPPPSPSENNKDKDDDEEEEVYQSFGWGIVKEWVLTIGPPTIYVTWKLTGSFLLGGLAILALPAAAILQGALHIIRFRIFYGGSPLPHVPCSGVVKAISTTTTTSSRRTSGNNNSSSNNNNTATRLEKDTRATIESLKEPAAHAAEAEAPSTGKTASTSSSNNPKMGADQAPLRLLVIGDSLAIGVGQSKHSTPVLPEAMAKTLSKALGGRPVIWTCYGGSGASAGWIVKELERSYSQPSQLSSSLSSSSVSTKNTTTSTTNNDSETETDESSSEDDDSSYVGDDESSSSSSHRQGKGTPSSTSHKFQQLAWHKRLFRQPHGRKLNDPNQQARERLVGGPYDIAIVFTGGNDVKSAFFPFLLTGEDAHLYQQAQQRNGGEYAEELRRILEVLNQKMCLRLQTLKQSIVEVAKENLRDYITVRDHDHDDHQEDKLTGRTGGTCKNTCSQSPVSFQPHPSQPSSTMSLRQPEELSSSDQEDPMSKKNGPSSSTPPPPPSTHVHPMVVLPGMPAPALPIFEFGPLRWFSLNIVNRMDSQKRKLARSSHPGEVLFVDAPDVSDLTAYQAQEGPYWNQKCTEETLLNVRDIQRRPARRIEAEMKHHTMQCCHQQTNKQQEVPRQPHYGLFSLDQIHPNDEGYDFWGRYIATAIVQEWKKNGTPIVVDPLD